MAEYPCDLLSTEVEKNNVSIVMIEAENNKICWDRHNIEVESDTYLVIYTLLRFRITKYP
jgi:hypothetical protein